MDAASGPLGCNEFICVGGSSRSNVEGIKCLESESPAFVECVLDQVIRN